MLVYMEFCILYLRHNHKNYIIMESFVIEMPQPKQPVKNNSIIARLTDVEFYSFTKLCERHNVSKSSMVRSLVSAYLKSSRG